MAVSQSARLFLQRAGRRLTLAGPLPALSPDANPVHYLSLQPPLPPAELLQGTQGDPPPDRGLTEQWPHGN